MGGMQYSLNNYFVNLIDEQYNEYNIQCFHSLIKTSILGERVSSSCIGSSSRGMSGWNETTFGWIGPLSIESITR